MTEQVDGAPPAGDTAPPVVAPENQSVQAPADAQALEGWAAALDEDTRTTAIAKGWDKLSDADRATAIAKSYVDLQKLSGSALHVPKPDATPEERQQFIDDLRKRRGGPDTPDGIEFKMPENLPESFVYDADMAAAAKPLLHQLGLFGEDAQKVHDFYVEHTNRQLAAYEQQQIALEQSAAETLTKAWGAPDSATHKENLAYVDRAIREAGGDVVIAELKANGLIGPAGEVRRAAGLTTMIAKLARQAFAEPSPPANGDAPSATTREQRWYPHLPPN